MKRFLNRAFALLLCGSLAACVNGPAYNNVTQSQGRVGNVGQPNVTVTSAQTRVGLMLPLSGQYAAVGKALQNAAQLAFYDNAPPSVELLVRDTGDNAPQAESAAADVAGQGAQVMIGPLTSPQVEAVQGTTRNQQTPILAFTTDTRLAGGQTFVLGFLPQGEVARILSYAVSQGKTQVAVLAPDDAYGGLIENAARSVAPQIGGLSLRSARYSVGDPASIQRAVNQISQSVRPQAILLAEAPGKNLTAVIAALNAAQMGPQRAQYLGTGLWDDAQVSLDKNLQGAWYAASDPEARARFQNRYRAQFGSNPPRLASLGYDGMALVAVTMRQNGGRFNPASLTNPVGFAGVDGVFRLLNDGTNERALAVLEVTPAQPRTRQAAPTQFGLQG